jgi:hypothetical protein
MLVVDDEIGFGRTGTAECVTLPADDHRECGRGDDVAWFAIDDDERRGTDLLTEERSLNEGVILGWRDVQYFDGPSVGASR